MPQCRETVRSQHARAAVVIRVGLTLLIALAVSGCVQRQDAGRTASSGDSQRTAPTSDSLPIRRLDASIAGIYRFNSGIRDSTFTTIRDLVRWEEMWRRLSAQHRPAQSPPPVDFQKEMVVVATLGERRTGGYAITIEAVSDRGAYLEAHVWRRAPGRDCGVGGMLTTPADVAIVPRREVEVRVLTHDRVTDCTGPREPDLPS
jgi:hypothetical protein